MEEDNFTSLLLTHCWRYDLKNIGFMYTTIHGVTLHMSNERLEALKDRHQVTVTKIIGGYAMEEGYDYDAKLKAQNTGRVKGVADLRAQLARRISTLNDIASFDETDFYKLGWGCKAKDTVDSLTATARLDAEILRCAECQYDEWIRPYPEGSMKTYEDSCEKTNNAVRKRNEYA